MTLKESLINRGYGVVHASHQEEDITILRPGLGVNKSELKVFGLQNMTRLFIGIATNLSR